MEFKILIMFIYFGLSESVKVNIDSAYEHFEEYAKDKRQAVGHDGNPVQRQLVFIHPGAYKHRSGNNQEYQQEDNEHSRNLFYPQQAQENPYILYANKYQQDTPIEVVPAQSRRLIDQQPKNNVDKQSPRNSNVFLPLEHRQVETIKPQRLIPEEQLLKLIEDELAARGFPLASRPFPTPGQAQHQIQSSPQNIVAEIANKAREVLPSYRAHSGNFVPVHYQPYSAYNIQNGKHELKINNIDKSITTSKVEETKQISNLNHNQRAQQHQKNVQSTVLPSFLENYNFIPFAQLNGYSTTPQPSKAAFTTAIPKQFVTENRLLKSTAPQTFIGFNDNQNKQITASTPRNNPYFSSQQYINPYVESTHKKPLPKKEAIVAGPLYAQKQFYSQDEHFNRNQQVPPSQSTIFVSQETGTHQEHIKSSNKKQYKIPNLGNKPLSPEEFQALVDAGYPVTAVPVPVPVPYEEFMKQQQQRLIETPLRPKQQVKLSAQSKLQNYLEPVHIQQQKQQEHNGGTVVSQNL